MTSIIAIAIGTMVGTGSGLILYTAIANRAKQVGGLTFIRLGRVQLSLCVVRRVPAKRLAFAAA